MMSYSSTTAHSQCDCSQRSEEESDPSEDMIDWTGLVHTCHPEMRVRNDWAASMCPYCAVPVAGYALDPSIGHIHPVSCPHLIAYRDTDGSLYGKSGSRRGESAIADVATHLPGPVCLTDGSLAVSESEWAVLYHRPRTNTDVTSFV